jgi:vancomycin resistance protein YoaR
MNVNYMLKIFAITSLSIVFLLTSFYGSIYAYDLFKSEVLGIEEKYTDQTRIGPLNVSGHTKTSATQLLKNKVTQWKSNSTITIVDTDGTALSVPTTSVDFNVQGSINALQNGQQNELVVSSLELTSEISTLYENSTFVDLDALAQDILANVKELVVRIEIDASNYVIEDGNIVVAESVVTNFKKDNYLDLWVASLNNKVIAANETTSLLTLLESEGTELVTSDSLSVIATALYKALLNTNFDILERHIGSSLPDYASLGFEAKVIPGELDLAFRNPNKENYVFQVYEDNNVLNVSIVGPSLPYRYVVSIKGMQQFKQKTIIHFSSSIQENEVMVKNEGQPGFLCTIYRNAFDEANNLVSNTLIAEDFYIPIHRVEIRYGSESNPE